MVAAVFLSCQGRVDLDQVESVCNWIVGVMMIALGR